MSLTPSEVRARILTEHGAIRTELDQLEALINRAEAGPSSAPELPAQVEAFTEGLLRHIADEEHLLRPTLAEIDAWGRQRVEKLDDGHAAQRARVDRLKGLAAGPRAPWLAELRALIASLREEMIFEEKDCLSPNLLRDDTVTIDYFGG